MKKIGDNFDIVNISELAWQIISDPIIYPIITAVIVAALSSYLTYHFATQKFKHENQFQNKLIHYQKIIDKMRGFVAGAENPADQQDFINSSRAIWLFGDAGVIKLLNHFFYTLIDDKSHTIEERRKEASICLQKIVLQMRKDLWTDGDLVEDDIKFYV